MISRTSRQTDRPSPTRRSILAGAAAAAFAGSASRAMADDSPNISTPPAVLKGHIQHSLVSWCYLKLFPSPEGLFSAAQSLGCKSVELIDPKHWDAIKAHGMTVAIASGHGYVKGMNNPKYWDQCISILKQRIDQSAAFGCPSVITFTGMAEDIPADVGMDNCVKGYKKIIGYAEEKKVTLCLEMLNSRHKDGFMQGHPGYQGDHTDYCIELIRRVGSERLKLLFDIYHVQIMDGDVITRIRQFKDYIGHVHTAGNPGRNELDDRQEIAYKPIMQALVDVGYKGYVGHEFIPTRDPMEGLRQAIAVCDV